ncbi:hypothetical protein [Subtercola lobariae]|uniref:Lipoprotein n=1 Tax=Subtercola lobariae TaxID=1588641 RepID=A0A917B168_9MICO|nr:hypothetical protein [Subtercola lobariae]GGF13846.1 hypothetical protein GCM10011399_04650 [Subtercola lobariae]
MGKISQRLVISAAAVVVSVSLAGCADLPAQVAAQIHPPGLSASADPNGSGQQTALDRFTAAAQTKIPSILASANGVFSAIDIASSPPDTIDYTYTYAKQIDPVAASQYFDGKSATLQASCDSDVFPAMKLAGITGTVHVVYTYVNADGSQIWSKDFTPSAG